MAVTKNCLLVLCALSAAVGATDVSNSSKIIAILNATSLDVTLHIDALLRDQNSAGTNALSANVESPQSLRSIIRAEINGDWQRGNLLLQLVNKTRSVQLKWAIYDALWQELQQSSQINNPIKILDFYWQLKKHNDVPVPLLQEIYSAFVSHSAQLLAAPFYTDSRSANFPLVNDLLQRLLLTGLDFFRDILTILYDTVLALQAPLLVAQRLSNYTAGVEQLTLANIQLLDREELQQDTLAQDALRSNLRHLLERQDFARYVDSKLRQKVYAQLPADESVLFTAQKICIRNVSNANAYIYECPQTYLICSNVRDPKKAAYFVQRGYNLNGTLQFAFYSSYWRNRYILLEPSAANNTNPHSITKNVYSRNAINWWRVKFVSEGVVLYDGASASFVLCGGDPQHWDGEEHHVYTRPAADFALYSHECVWRMEDCGNATQ